MLDGASGLVNLVGRSVDGVKTPENQDETLRSRVEATRALGLAVRSLEAPPRIEERRSAIGISAASSAQGRVPETTGRTMTRTVPGWIAGSATLH